ncbi:ParB/RepB/Spo0J family partition protein [Thermophilibacter immobilis]|mgnify:CR=1 FL=1|nr:ParB/RepB/Spo0J family partition protein [Thermophilibacter immobilis]
MAKKSGLGKGLGMLVGEADAETAGMHPDSTLPISKVHPNKGQPRKSFKPDELSELTDSIRQNGILQPLLVRKKGVSYEIVAGERRFQAAQLAGLNEVPVVIREISDEDVFKLALIENLQRSDLSPLEEARGYRQLIDQKDLTQEELAQILSKSRSTITNTLRLLDLPDEVQELVNDGKLTAGHARAILAVPTEDGRRHLAQKVVDERLSVRQTESLAPLFSVNQDVEIRHRTPAPAYFKRVQRQLRLALDTNVKVKNVRGKNKLEIEFESEDQLGHIVNLLSGPGTWSGE